MNLNSTACHQLRRSHKKYVYVIRRLPKTKKRLLARPGGFQTKHSNYPTYNSTQFHFFAN